MPAASKIVEWHQLLQVVYSALAAGIGVTIAFSFAVAGATRFVEQTREGAPGWAALYAVLTVLGLAVVVGAVVLGIVVMTKKS